MQIQPGRETSFNLSQLSNFPCLRLQPYLIVNIHKSSLLHLQYHQYHQSPTQQKKQQQQNELMKKE